MTQLKINWKTYEVSGKTVVEVSKGANKLRVVLPNRKAKSMSPTEFDRLLKRLQEAIELYDDEH